MRRRKWRMARILRLRSTKRSIGFPLAIAALYRAAGVFSVINAKGVPFVVPESNSARYRFKCCWLTWW